MMWNIWCNVLKMKAWNFRNLGKVQKMKTRNKIEFLTPVNDSGVISFVLVSGYQLSRGLALSHPVKASEGSFEGFPNCQNDPNRSRMVRPAAFNFPILRAEMFLLGGFARFLYFVYNVSQLLLSSSLFISLFSFCFLLISIITLHFP